jgi:two-component system phosphate regulon sensor histidine kinase PhoR
MNRKTLNGVIILGIISVVSILLIQVLWINKTTSLQNKNIVIQQREDSLNLIRFTEQTHRALRNVLEDISSNKSDSSDLYGAVNQVESNYFTVDINEDLHPYYLETLLKREFYNQDIRQDFQYGIYDCFTDSIVFGNLITYTKDAQFSVVSNSDTPQISEDMFWQRDGHYFTVFFPNVGATRELDANSKLSPYFYLILIVVLVVAFFGFTVVVLLRQKKLSEVKTDFINNMTHELKTPISTIGLSSEMIMRANPAEDSEKIQKYASLIYKENKRLQNQVERVLNVAKLDENKIALKKEEFDMHDLLLEVKDNFDFNQNEKGGNIKLELNAEFFVLNVDSVHITNVVYNLMDNAIKYCKEKPEVVLRTSSDKKFFVFEIEDNGIGLSRDNIKMIFDKFYRVPTGNLHDVKGFGLGLYYVKLVVEAHKGVISVKSNLEKGSVFTIKLPI